jgi:hypothetical protein
MTQANIDLVQNATIACNGISIVLIVIHLLRNR